MMAGTPTEEDSVTLHCAVLDDYQGVALTSADWSVPARGVEVTVSGQHLEEDPLTDAQAGLEIVGVMRERTPMTAARRTWWPRRHLGYVTRRNYAGAFQMVAEDSARFLADSPVRRLW
jgi:hypothetical protein